MKIVFLGTGSGAPTRSRNVSAIGLQLVQQAKLWLLDCGEGTQHQLLRAPLRISQLERIFITHLHGDHCFGLPGLLASRSLSASSGTPVTLYGPMGIEELVRGALERTQTRLGYPLRFQRVEEGCILDDGEMTVRAMLLPHRMESYGYAFREHDRVGAFDAARAAALGIPFGPVYGALKRGETVTLPDGRCFDGREFVGPDQPGRCVTYTGDTMASPRVEELARTADVLIHEATYAEADRGLAARGAHSTAVDAARAAKAAGVGRLILTHISSRYEAESSPGPGLLLEEARAIFHNTSLARDFAIFDVPRNEAAQRQAESVVRTGDSDE